MMEVVKIKAEKCPDCEGKIEIPDDVLKGEILTCPDCGLELEVKELNGNQIILATLVLEKEDWGE